MNIQTEGENVTVRNDGDKVVITIGHKQFSEDYWTENITINAVFVGTRKGKFTSIPDVPQYVNYSCGEDTKG